MTKYKFNKWQRAWIDELKSGKTRKAKGALLDGSKECCLGVGARVCRVCPAEIAGEGDLDSFPDVVEMLKLNDEIGSFSDPGIHNTRGRYFGTLTEMNDGVTNRKLQTGALSHQTIGKLLEEKPWLFFRDAENPNPPEE